MTHSLNVSLLDMGHSFFKAGIQAEESKSLQAAVQHYCDAAEAYYRYAQKSSPCTDKQKYIKMSHDIVSRAEQLMISFSPTFLSSRSVSLSSSEIEVLKKASKIHNLVFLPWVHADSRSVKTSPNYTDPNGLFTLTERQASYFTSWRRATEFSNSMKSPEPKSIKQTLISDCSFVASLIVASNYEKTFSKSLFSSIIYPQRNFQPHLSPSGHYIIRLKYNGVFRRIDIDDFLPYSNRTKYPLLCSFSTTGSLLVPLLEKAFLKLNGCSYKFKGSWSSYDLNCLFGFVPETIDLSKEQELKKALNRFVSGHQHGYCLATLSSDKCGQLNDATPIESHHAYAVLEVKNGNVKIMNPWQTGGLLNDGVFSVELNSLSTWFKHLDLSWDVHQLFPSSKVIHFSLEASRFSSLFNSPQFVLNFSHSKSATDVWILLERHRSLHSDEQFSTCHLQLSTEENSPDMDKQILNYDSRKFFLRGSYSNSYHLLHKFELWSDQTELIAAIDQTSRDHYASFSLSVFSTSPFSLRQLSSSYAFTRQFDGAWGTSNSGGRRGSVGWLTNPQFGLFLGCSCNVVIGVNASLDLSVGCSLCRVSTWKQPITESSIVYDVIETETYYIKSNHLKLNLSAGSYIVIPSTFDPGNCGSFSLAVYSMSDSIEVCKLI
ncbi:hypothetical protein P9112_005694 [Eukaryota sp. TZLM1-RC]